MSENQSNVQAAIDAVERLAEPQRVGLGTGAEGELYAMPKGLQVVDLKPYLDARRDRPERVKGTAKLTTLASFIAHAQRFADPHTAIFAVDDARAPKLVAVFDYHEGHVRQLEGDDATSRDIAARGLPRFGEHRAEYAFPLSEPWKAWTSIIGKQLSQADFAAFLEERIADVLSTDAIGEGALAVARALRIQLAGPDDIMTLSKGLAVRVDAKVTQAVNLSSGEASIGFEETHRGADGAPLKIPGGFAVHLPVFRGGDEYALVVRLRYRVHAGAVTWAVQLQRVTEAFDDAFRDACGRASGETGLPLFYGQPEA